MFTKYSKESLNFEEMLGTDDKEIMVERIAAKHHIQLLDGSENIEEMDSDMAELVDPKSQNEKSFFLSIDDPNILKLTQTNWLSKLENKIDETSTPSISTSSSRSSSEVDLGSNDDADKQLNKLLQWDKEMGMFGVSSLVAIPTPRMKKEKNREKPAFFQTAIVQHCCVKRGCRHQSNSDLPTSLKCGGCGNPCGLPCSPYPCKKPSCVPCPVPICPAPCKPPPCKVPRICRGYSCRPGGFKLVLKKKTKFETSPIEITPRSSCIFNKPVSARPCYVHPPGCCPPTPCYPCIPCNGKARNSAPCTVPTRCFHNPPCLPARVRKTVFCPNCPQGARCDGTAVECGRKCKAPQSAQTKASSTSLRQLDKNKVLTASQTSLRALDKPKGSSHSVRPKGSSHNVRARGSSHTKMRVSDRHISPKGSPSLGSHSPSSPSKGSTSPSSPPKGSPSPKGSPK